MLAHIDRRRGHRSPVTLTQEQRNVMHADWFMLAYLEQLRDSMCCLEDVAVIEEQIDKFKQVMEQGK